MQGQPRCGLWSLGPRRPRVPAGDGRAGEVGTRLAHKSPGHEGGPGGSPPRGWWVGWKWGSSRTALASRQLAVLGAQYDTSLHKI